MNAATHPSPLRSTLLLTLGLLCLVLPGAAHALERITLHNGFSYDCTRHEQLDGSHLRLFLTQNDAAAAGQQSPQAFAAQQAANYVDLPSAEVASVELLPDPPTPAIHDAAHSTSASANPDLHAILTSAGAAHDIDVELLASIVQAESGGRAAAVSRVGAVGLMQLMPSTARALGVADVRQPDQNIRGGTAYLDSLLTRYRNNLALALAAYNAGPAAVDRYRGVPPFRETRAYVVRVMREFKRRKEQMPTAPPVPGRSLLASSALAAATAVR